MTRPWVADEANGFQIWRVVANILNKQSRTADKRWSSRWWLGDGLTIHYYKKQLVTKCYLGVDGRIILEWILGK
jgi:hypothetical protein